MDAINDAINTAKNAAAAVPATTPAPTQATAPATMPAARPRSLADALASAGAAVEKWLTVDEYGLHVAKDKATFDTIDVTIKLADVKFGYGVRYQTGAGVQYGKSYDGVREARTGQPWGEFVANAQRMDAKCRGSYDLAEIPMTLEQELKLKDGTVVEKGTRVGHSTSIMNFRLFMAWVQSAMNAGYSEQDEIKVRLSLKTATGGGNEYGMINFETVQ